MHAPIPFVLCFDVEPDEIEVEPGAQPWYGFERLLERVGPLRDELAAATGRPATFNWFLRMDPQIADAYGSAAWVVDRYGDQIDDLRRQGDGIGLHPHALRRAADGSWVSDHGDDAWVDHCIRYSYKTFETALGEPCQMQRNGDRFMTARTARLAAELGARFDLSVEPGARAVGSLHPGTASTAATPDMRSAPRGPYRPATDDAMRRNDATGAGGDGLWMIPLTSMDPDPMLPTWRRIARRIRHRSGPWHRPTTLTAAWPAAPFWPMIERELATMRQPYLAFAIRSDAPLIPHLMDPIEAKLAALRTSPLAGRLSFTGPAAVVGEART